MPRKEACVPVTKVLFFVFRCRQRDMAGISRKLAITLSSRGGKCYSLVGSPHQLSWEVLWDGHMLSSLWSTMQHHRAAVFTLPVAIGGFRGLDVMAPWGLS